MSNEFYQLKADSTVRITVISGLEDGAESVLYYATGGGFQRKMTRVQFDQEFIPAEPLRSRAATVTADFIGPDFGRSEIPCFTTGARWNGWGIPSFTKQNLILLFESMDSPGSLSFEGEVARIALPDDEEVILIQPEEIDVQGEKVQVYHTHSLGWTFDRCEFLDEKKST